MSHIEYLSDNKSDCYLLYQAIKVEIFARSWRSLIDDALRNPGFKAGALVVDLLRNIRHPDQIPESRRLVSLDPVPCFFP